MASATGIPAQAPLHDAATEDEPLLGGPGDASQRREKGLWFNLLLGTAVIAQGGIWILVAIIWAGIFTHKVILFSTHPLLNSAGLFFIVQATLILQPTHTKDQKIRGTYVHAALNDVGLGLLLAGLILIEYNKINGGQPHFHSVHAYLGVITYAIFFIQATVGFMQFFTPGLLGGEAKAKKLYKYHRMSGYALLVFSLATVCAATKTDYIEQSIHIKLWAVAFASVLVLIGVLPRVKKQKLGF
ncbi:MAG: hypothetical protein M1824_006327 [Vezdaea acicularis]|nr:MAG: hypothetical protein M1824_006327 [Vezdaea acicularis]